MSIVDKIQERIDKALLTTRDKPRSYLGASVLGEECARKIWYYVNDPKEVDDPQTLRKFEVGKRLEPMVVKLLKDAGYQLFCVGDDQIRFEDGNIAGSGDGVIKGIDGDEDTPYLLEVKTSNEFSFKQFKKQGIDANEKYKGQVMIYMKYFRLSKCLFVVLNKDNQEIYMEIVSYDEFESERLIQRGKHILTLDTEPERHYNSKSWFKCQWCSWKKECWK